VEAGNTTQFVGGPHLPTPEDSLLIKGKVSSGVPSPYIDRVTSTLGDLAQNMTSRIEIGATQSATSGL